MATALEAIAPAEDVIDQHVSLIKEALPKIMGFTPEMRRVQFAFFEFKEAQEAQSSVTPGRLACEAISRAMGGQTELVKAADKEQTAYERLAEAMKVMPRCTKRIEDSKIYVVYATMACDEKNLVVLCDHFPQFEFSPQAHVMARVRAGDCFNYQRLFEFNLEHMILGHMEG